MSGHFLLRECDETDETRVTPSLTDIDSFSLEIELFNILIFSTEIENLLLQLPIVVNYLVSPPPGNLFYLLLFLVRRLSRTLFYVIKIVGSCAGS